MKGEGEEGERGWRERKEGTRRGHRKGGREVRKRERGNKTGENYRV